MKGGTGDVVLITVLRPPPEITAPMCGALASRGCWRNQFRILSGLHGLVGEV